MSEYSWEELQRSHKRAFWRNGGTQAVLIGLAFIVCAWLARGEPWPSGLLAGVGAMVLLGVWQQVNGMAQRFRSVESLGPRRLSVRVSADGLTFAGAYSTMIFRPEAVVAFKSEPDLRTVKLVTGENMYLPPDALAEAEAEVLKGFSSCSAVESATARSP